MAAWATNSAADSQRAQDADGAKPALTGQGNSSSFSVMSYDQTVNDNRRIADFQLCDIASLRSLDGRDDSSRSGSDTFAWFDFAKLDPNQVVPVRSRYWSS